MEITVVIYNAPIFSDDKWSDSFKKENIMRDDYTHICVVLDASGSMETIKEDSKGSMNEFIKKQQGEPGKTVFELYQFSDNSQRIVSPVDVKEVGRSLMDHYECSGCTALYDAVCRAIDELGTELAAMPESERPANVLFVILTDGMENASKRFTSDDAKKRIECQRTVYNWEFLFLAANQDAFAAGEALGVPHEYCAEFEATPEGMAENCERMYAMAEVVRSRPRK